MKFWAVFDRIIGILAAIAGVVVIFTMLVVTSDVSLRFLFNAPIIWAPEITEICLLFITFLSIAWLLKEDGHVRVDIVLARVSQSTQAILCLISAIIGIVVSVFLIWQGILVSLQYTREGLSDPTVLELPKGPLLAIIPLGSFLLLIQFLRNTYGSWKRWRVALMSSKS